MTENQKLWLDELIEEHKVAACNERLWSKGTDDEEQARLHEQNSEEHFEFAEMLKQIRNL